MYSASHPVSTTINGVGGGIVDGAGTINPAALDPTVLSNTSAVLSEGTGPRGIKRSRSPDTYGELSLPGEGADDNDGKPRKRGRPPKPKPSDHVSESQGQRTPQQTATRLPHQMQTPQPHTQTLPPPSHLNTPALASPSKPTPTKTVVKALPTVRDHTTDQLGPEGDEYIPREYDEAGDRKVSPTGHPLEGREYRCRTFLVPNRGNKLFMLATECARVLGYRDSYLLFNKNRSLFKIIASQAEKDDLIHQEILPYSYRSRQIAIVTARSMFRQFGSRVIVNGRRVRDDYWESKARKQGFTEEDLAGEKRPGGGKARDAAAAEAASALAAAPAHADVVYNPTTPHLDPHNMPPQTVTSNIMAPGGPGLGPLPMIQTDDLRLRDYGNVARPRQEMTGPPYQDRTQPGSAADMLNHAQQTAEFNKVLTQQRAVRGKYMDDFWNKPREAKVTPPQHVGTSAEQVSASLAHPSPPLTTTSYYSGDSQPSLPAQPRAPQQLVGSHGYHAQPHHPSTLGHSSPLKSIHGSIRSDNMPQRSPGLGLGSGSALSNSNPYGVAHQTHQTQMWPTPQPLQSPISQPHHSLPQYSPQARPQQSPHQQPSHQGSVPHPAGQQLPNAPLHYQSMAGMSHGGYPSSTNRNLYQQPYMHPSTTSAQPALQGWAPSSQNTHGSAQGWTWSTSG